MKQPIEPTKFHMTMCADCPFVVSARSLGSVITSLHVHAVATGHLDPLAPNVEVSS